MRRLRLVFLCLLVLVGMAADCDPVDPNDPAQPEPVPDNPSTEPAQPGPPGRLDDLIEPPAHHRKARYSVLSGAGACGGSMLATIVERNTGRAPRGHGCDPWMWNAGGITDPNLVNQSVQFTLSKCTDRWIVQATIEELGRLPLDGECDTSIYNNGTWRDYDHLAALVRDLPKTTVRFNAERKRWRVAVLVWETADAYGTRRVMCDPSPCTAEWWLSLHDALKEIAQWVSTSTHGVVTWEFRVIPARGPMVDPGKVESFTMGSPKAAESELRGYVGTNEYDSVIAVVPGYHTNPIRWVATREGEGLTVMTGNESSIGTQGATYAWVVGPPPDQNWRPRSAANKVHIERIIHEWLHGVEQFYRTKGFSAELPKPEKLFSHSCIPKDASLVHGGSCFGINHLDEEGTAMPFRSYTLIAGGQLSHSAAGGPYGVSRDMWNTGGPRTSRYPFVPVP